MKKELHPKYQLIKATCSCGNVMEVNSTLSEDISVEICSKCHPFYTGQQKIVDTGGRVQRFEKKFGKTS
ncbi:50S ribosomal protein L31 [Bacteroidota bacterium]|jgi:large subunit ribosomal protein L31|nr:50S ribosomal protein L31 [Gammaproteobacteria bacterium]MDA9715692.1 50S ribosomal protein L31 [Bacteroidota bacterium]MEC7479471.1 50S ribosomal protein L31 [Pseudomonadota bacterium]MEC7859080.1 50S ribosomal protein L31 [Pseudomonadota bacterium]MEC8097500.1 50S ribosomal protein L31 [Pseudomonadota bacterium]|tara:strand:- start:36846 stop:37052 length:207 start_codon:yes stop_codon:yes gene_type:complete